MRSYLKATGIVLLAGGLLLSGCNNNGGQNENNAGGGQANKNEAEPAPGKQKGDFPIWGYNYQQTRHAPYKKITKENVKNLGVIWEKDLKKLDSSIPAGSESFPIVKDGVLYVTTAKDHVFAFDAVSGKKIWHWKPSQKDLQQMQGLVGNRGAAVANGKVFVLLGNNKLAKIDAKTGKTDKMIAIGDTVPEAKGKDIYETVAPMYYKGNIYIGSSGGDNGARCFVMAYKASDLSPAWDKPFYTVPKKGQGWLKNSKFTGGGAVWDPPSFDPETDIMYFGVGNPAPDFYGKIRPGSNPYTDSVVALNSKTGKLIWAKQEISHDQWDYDAAATPMVLNAKVNGKQKKVVVQGGKSGQWWAWDAKTGKTIYDGVQFNKIKHPKPTPEGVLAYPGVLGGENYAPETYDPASNYVLIPGIESPGLLKSAKNEKDLANHFTGVGGAGDMGTTYALSPKNTKEYGTITAIDMNTGKKVYHKKTENPMRGGFTSTASGLAFYGEMNGKMHAIDIKSGKNVWTFQTSGTQIQSAPAIFMQDGKEYMAVAEGDANSKVIVFGLGGDKEQGTSSGKVKNVDPHNEGKNNNQNGQGGKSSAAQADPKKIYQQNCASCHGNNLQGVSGPSLQHVGGSMSKEDILRQINNGGGRMPGGLIKGKQAEAVARWLSKKK
jgi:alcohol dehydrogenase (cytochrome c)